MHSQSRRALALIAVLVAASGAGAAPPPAATTWRCGNSYSDQPCAGGRAVSVDDRRSDADSRAQTAHTRDVQRRADAMARERQALEAQAVTRRAAVIAPPPAPAARLPVQEMKKATKPKTHRPGKPTRAASDAFKARDASAAADAHGNKKKRKAAADAG